MNRQWVEPDVRDAVVDFVGYLSPKVELPAKYLLRLIGISSSKFYSWKSRVALPNNHNGSIPKEHWCLPWEKEAIIAYAKSHREQGYRRLTYMMLDEDVVAVSPSTTYRVLKNAGLLHRFNAAASSSKGTGFKQPVKPHQHWHTDIKYVNFKGTFLFLISVIDGYSRFIVHHELRHSMQEFDVTLTIQRALEKYPEHKPRIISDNGGQYIAKDFALFIKEAGLKHIRTSPNYPQANGKIERFHRTINQECLRKRSLINVDDAKKQIASYIDHYNSKRLHSALFFLTPEDFLLDRVKERLNERERKLTDARKMRAA